MTENNYFFTKPTFQESWSQINKKYFISVDLSRKKGECKFSACNGKSQVSKQQTREKLQPINCFKATQNLRKNEPETIKFSLEQCRRPPWTWWTQAVNILRVKLSTVTDPVNMRRKVNWTGTTAEDREGRWAETSCSFFISWEFRLKISVEHTDYIQKERVTKAAPPKPAVNPMQFVAIKPSNLFQTAQEQLKKAEEVRKAKEVNRKEEPEDWQNVSQLMPTNRKSFFMLEQTANWACRGKTK